MAYIKFDLNNKERIAAKKRDRKLKATLMSTALFATPEHSNETKEEAVYSYMKALIAS